MFIPFTTGSKLQKLLQSTDNDYIRKGKNKRIKFVERGGSTLEQVLGKSDPWGGRGCPRPSCFQCQHGGGEGGECQREGALYEVMCLRCKELGVVASYVGESSRTGYMRGEDHADDLGARREGKPLWEHSRESHEGTLSFMDYNMEVLKTYKTALQRQIGEALLIEKRSLTNDI